jgi:hypothetical protein
VAFLALFGAGVGLVLLGTPPSGLAQAPELRALIQGAANRASVGDLAAVWELLAPSSRRQFASSHDTLLKVSAGYRRNRQDDRRASIAASALERQYGMPLKDLERTTPAEVWERRIASSLGRRGPVVREFADLRIESIETDGTRAAVRARLPDGRSQGFHLVREEGRWWFVDFRPGLTLQQAGDPVRRAASVAPGLRPEQETSLTGPGAVAPR